jgi:hypothetical protein
MKKTLASLLVIGLMSGCATTDWSKPIIPTVPPPKPNSDGKETTARSDGIRSRADVEKKEPASAKESVKQDSRPRGPVTPGQVTDRNAQDVMKALEAELEQDANASIPK